METRCQRETHRFPKLPRKLTTNGTEAKISRVLISRAENQVQSHTHARTHTHGNLRNALEREKTRFSRYTYPVWLLASFSINRNRYRSRNRANFPLQKFYFYFITSHVDSQAKNFFPNWMKGNYIEIVMQSAIYSYSFH